MPKRRPDHIPMRTCAACREVRPKRSLTRVVRSTTGTVTIDPSGKLAGRGTYICDQPTCRVPETMRAAVSRALGVDVTPESLAIEEKHAAT